MSSTVSATGSAASAREETPFSMLLAALQSGDAEKALNAAKGVLNGKGAGIQGDSKSPGFLDQLNTAFQKTMSQMTGAEQTAVGQALKMQDGTPARTVGESVAPTEQRTAPDAATSNAARRHAQVGEQARRAALEIRLPVEDMDHFLGPWDPSVAANALGILDKSKAALAAEKANVAGAMKEIGADIAGLEAKSARTPAEDRLLAGKRLQLDAFNALGQAIDLRIDSLAKSGGALKYDNFGGETSGGPEVSIHEAAALAQHGAGIDVALDGKGSSEGIVQIGQKADAAVIAASAQLDAERAAAPKAAQAAPATAASDGKGPAAAAAPAAAAGAAAAKGQTVTVKEGQWLSRIAANAKGPDGKTVSVEQLLAMPENKHIKDKNAGGNLIHPGDKITLPPGFTHPDGVAPPAVAAAPARPANGPVRGLASQAQVREVDNRIDAAAAAAAGGGAVSALAKEGAAKRVDLLDKAMVRELGGGAGKTTVPREMPEGAKVLEAFKGLSGPDAKAVVSAFEEKHGPKSFDALKEKMQPWEKAAVEASVAGSADAPKLLEAAAKKTAEIKEKSDLLWDAVDGFGTKNKVVIQTLKSVASKEDMAALERQFASDHPDEGGLRARVLDDMSDTPVLQKRAEAYFDGKKDLASAIAVKDFADSGNVKDMKGFLTEVPEDRRAAVGKAFQESTGGVSIREAVDAMLTGPRATGLSTMDRAALQKLASAFDAPAPASVPDATGHDELMQNLRNNRA